MNGNGVAWAFVAVGVFGLVVAALLARRSVRLLRSGGSALGTVVNTEEEMVSGRGASKRYYFPVVTFTTSKGQSIRFTSTSGRGAALAKGSRVKVVFDPERPFEASLASFGVLWFFPLLVVLFSLPFLLAGLSGVLPD